MPKNGQDWPLVRDMIASSQRLLVFTSKKLKQATEGIAYQWNFMVENNCEATVPPYWTLLCNSWSCIHTCCLYEIYGFPSVADGDDGMDAGKCSNRAESAALNDKTKSLVLMNYFPSVPVKLTACLQHSNSLTDMVNTCYGAAGNRWANFIAVDYYKVNVKLVECRSTVQHFQFSYNTKQQPRLYCCDDSVMFLNWTNSEKRRRWRVPRHRSAQREAPVRMPGR